MIAPPQAFASAWNYGCKGVLPVFHDSAVIIFNRDRLVLLPKAFADQQATLRYLAFGDATDAIIEVAKAADGNSGLAQIMVFTLATNPEKKLTLTETSSKTVSNGSERAGAQPRNAQVTYYKKVYRYVSDFGFMGPFEIKMDCVNYELSAPVR
ncbi:MAG TPA: hypothetical protein VFB45_05610 [Pseudolabrys sp.]|nr:hypothetical protein [Pseudolabrys sp.]